MTESLLIVDENHVGLSSNSMNVTRYEDENGAWIDIVDPEDGESHTTVGICFSDGNPSIHIVDCTLDDIILRLDFIDGNWIIAANLTVGSKS